ncbi:hypothetical protein KBJ98_07720 [Flavobacterium sp. F-328]|uniref:Lipoprotein n=1 Tax=Flavobacterium erciyesense TaxID=2825842 RepID=A0ABS5D3N4_9FLAO|nr:hypothetical protein [Flavobacterium erciyesense]MBQ0908585.1 hypothetical protein [Flavobacterium erciyesense]
MKIASVYITLISLLIFSCGKEDKKESTNKKAETTTEGNYISKKWKSTKEVFVDSDSLLKIKKDKYFKELRNKYPEFKYVQKWFESNPKELLGLKGDYYKMIKATYEDDANITYENLIAPGDRGTFKYLFVNDDAYYIYEFLLKERKIKPVDIRRIRKGYGAEPMHELTFDRNHLLEKEIFKGDVDQDLFTKNGHLFFKFGKDVDDKRVTNTIDLGTERDF